MGPVSGEPATRPDRTAGDDPRTVLMQLIVGYRISQVIGVLARLRIPDLLASGPLTADAIASELRLDSPSVYRFLRAAGTLTLLQEVAPRTFAATALSDCLRDGVPGSLRGMAIAFTAPGFWQPWGRALESLREGRAQAAAALGAEYWDYVRDHPEESDPLHDSASRRMDALVRHVPGLLDLADRTLVVDVGAGHGRLLAAILEANPSVRGVLFDRPEIVAGSVVEHLPAALASRCEVRAGDVMEAVPGGGDVYLLKEVVHNFTEEDATRALTRCRDAMPDGARVVLIEQVLPPDGERSLAQLSDLNMLVVSGGRERTRDDFAALFESAGLRLDRVVPIPSDHQLRGWALIVGTRA